MAVMSYGGNFSAVGGFSFFGGNDFGGGGKSKIWQYRNNQRVGTDWRVGTTVR